MISTGTGCAGVDLSGICWRADESETKDSMLPSCIGVYTLSGASVMILLTNYRQTDSRTPHLRRKIRKHHDTRLEELGAAGFSRRIFACTFNHSHQ